MHEVLEFYARAGSAVTEDMWLPLMSGQSRDGFAFLLDDHRNEIGYQAVCTPGSVKGYAQALSRYGTFDWRDVMAPAIDQARRGFMVRPHVYSYWYLDQQAAGQVNTRGKLALTSTGRRVYFNVDGSLKRPDQIISNPDLIRTLERLAEEGPESFYTGAIAREIAPDMAAQGGFITHCRLARHRHPAGQRHQSRHHPYFGGGPRRQRGGPDSYAGQSVRRHYREARLYV
ncbi:gamma-glutamyltransferase [Sodalis glossinidius]|uniref:gamma-glutamyltransferase n=1 Tax=Sodalis glossinidius TaxID=63612 RepID=UPI0002F58028|nr:gamma-glutamyltransferase [Sodalis glossinidius]